MKNFVGLSRQYHWVPDAQKSAASSSNTLGPFLYSGSLSSGWAEPLIFDVGASYRFVGNSQDPPASEVYPRFPSFPRDLEISEPADVPKDRPQNVKAVFVTTILPRAQSEVYPHFP